jgi:hypothetical protein
MVGIVANGATFEDTEKESDYGYVRKVRPSY